jgi:hypothetical protein
MRETPALLDHLIGSGEQGCRHGEVQHQAQLHVNDELELRRLYDVAGCAPLLVTRFHHPRARLPDGRARHVEVS